MSTQYPVLYDRPINKWKVAELKEELKRRNLMTKGLKDDLVRRLDEAIRNERASFGTETYKDFEPSNNEPNIPILQPHSGQISGFAENKYVNEVKVDNFVSGIPIVDETSEVDQAKATGGSISVPAYVESDVLCNAVDTSNNKDELVSTPIGFSECPERVIGNSGPAKGNEILTSARKDDLDNEGILEASGKSSGILNEVVDTHTASISTNTKNESAESGNEELEVVPIAGSTIAPISTSTKNESAEAGNEDLEVVPIADSEQNSHNFGLKLENDSLKPSQMDAESLVSYSSNQVHEISPNLGFQVQCESIKTDSLSNYEKNEIKENLNANNIQLEPEVVRQEMVQPSSSKDPSGGSFYSLDDQVPDVKPGSVVEADDDKCSVKNIEKIDNSGEGSAMDHILENSIQYAKTKSDVVAKADGTFVPREKRKKSDDRGRKKKDQHDAHQPGMGLHPAYTSPYGATPPLSQLPYMAGSKAAMPEAPAPPNNILFVQNLPHQTTPMMLQMLSCQYPGFKEVRMVEAKPGIAFVEYENEIQSTVAMQALQGFKITAENPMLITYAKK